MGMRSRKPHQKPWPFLLTLSNSSSLTHPSAQLGLYTIKGTPGLQSRHGIVTGSYWHDTPGSLARSMTDVAHLLDIMAGPDALDNLTSSAVGQIPADGYASKFRKDIITTTPVVKSKFYALELIDCQLPTPGIANVVIGSDAFPVLLYQIGNAKGEVRMLVDVKGKLPSVADGSLKVSL